MPSTARAALTSLLVRAVWSVRSRVLERPLARAVLRGLGRPAIALMHRLAGASPPGTLERAADPTAEAVLHLPFDYVPGPLAPAPRIAVLVHAYYPELLPEIVTHLRRIPCPADVFVSTDKETKRPAIEGALSDWPGAVEIRVLPNRGRNIAPQLVGFREVYDRYDLVLMLHTKASSHTDELAGWRSWILKNLLPSSTGVRHLLEAFDRLPQLGIAAPSIYPEVRRHLVWSPNFAACRRLAERLGVALAPDSPLDFPAGAMFWARPAALAPLFDLALSFDDFEAEAGQQDATLAHAVERLFFHACELSGRRWIRVGSGGEAWPDRWFRPDSPAALRRCVTDLSRTVLLPGRPPHPTRTARPPEADPKAALRRVCVAELDAFLDSGERLRLPTSDQPEVSIVILTFNEAELTLQCLRSLRFGLDRPSEVIVIDNASSDRTGALLDRLDGVRIVRNAENKHFVRGVNQGAALARGEAILLLNNDARVRPGSIGAAWDRLEKEPDVGAVCGRIVLPDGTLQEAGSIIWNDGSCVGHGRGLDPEDGAFQFRRDVDYGSGAFLMIRRSAFESLGGLDEAFAPAYYEETDLCMRLRAAALRVTYEPKVLVWHFEFGSSGAEAAMALQAEHQKAFVARHAEALARDHHAPGTSELVARRRGGPQRRVLILDDQVPYPHLGAGYPRALELLRAAHDAGWFVTFYPVIFADADYPTAYAGVLPPDVEIAAEYGREGLARFLGARRGYYDATLVSRPHNMQALETAVRERPDLLDRDRLIYDAEAIFAARDELRPGVDPAVAQKAVKAEASLAQPAALVLSVSGRDADSFRAAGARDVRVLGHALEATPTPQPFAERSGLLFVGALDEDDSPNVDSLVFFLDEVAPLLDDLIGDGWTLQVAGRNGASRLRGRGSDRVRLLGPVPDLTPLYAGARLFIAPTRFAAGIPMKVHQAAAYGLPTVATSLLAGQLGWSDGAELLVADEPQAFAEACARLYNDPRLWRRVRQGGLAAVARDCSPEAFRRTVADALTAIAG